MKRRKHAIVQTRSKGLMANTNKLTPEGVSLTGTIVQKWVEIKGKITRPTGQKTPRQGEH
jgi:hypothetical protein